MHSQTQNSDGSSRWIEGQTAYESMRLDNAGAESYGVSFVSFTAEGAASADRIDMTFQVTDRAGRSINNRFAVLVYPAAADGTKVVSGVTAFTILTGTTMMTPTNSAVQAYYIYPDTNGAFSVGFTVTGGAATRRAVVMLPDGRLLESTTMTWA